MIDDICVICKTNLKENKKLSCIYVPDDDCLNVSACTDCLFRHYLEKPELCFVCGKEIKIDSDLSTSSSFSDESNEIENKI